MIGITGKNATEISNIITRLSNCKFYKFDIAIQSHVQYNTILITEYAHELADILPTLAKGNYLIVNSDVREIFPLLSNSNASVITYGFNARACITASSITDSALQICIQRKFTNALDQEVMVQEFPVKLAPGEKPEHALGAAALLTVLGSNL